MLNTLGIVEVRRGDGRDWGISRKLGGKAILEWVVRRATDCERLDAVVVLCGDDAADSVRRLVPPDVEVLTTKGCDPLAATANLCDRLKARSVVHLSADHPFIDPVLVDRLVTTADAAPRLRLHRLLPRRRASDDSHASGNLCRVVLGQGARRRGSSGDGAG